MLLDVAPVDHVLVEGALRAHTVAAAAALHRSRVPAVRQLVEVAARAAQLLGQQNGIGSSDIADGLVTEGGQASLGFRSGAP